MEKKTIHGVEVSEVKVDLDGMDGPRVWFKVNGLQTLEWLKKADDGEFWVEGTNVYKNIVKIASLDKNGYDEFLDELYDYLDGIVFEQTQEAMLADPNCYELRFGDYGRMPLIGGTGSTLDLCVLCAQKIEELEFYMREQKPLDRERYYIAQCVTHKVLQKF